MLFSVTYIVCEGLKIDAYMSRNIMFANCQYDTIHQHEQFFCRKNYLNYDI